MKSADSLAEPRAEVAIRLAAQQENAQLQQQLHQAQKLDMLGQLAAGVAHDFGNLATIILGNAALIRENLADQNRVLTALEIIEETAVQAAEMTRSLLSFNQGLPLRKENIDLGDAVRRSLRICRWLLPAAIVVSEEPNQVHPLTVQADSIQIHQVLLNLLINARDAMPDGGHLRVRVAPAAADTSIIGAGPASVDGYALLEVSDTGHGIPPEIQGRIFDPFFTTKPQGQGTGLGLAITQGIVRSHAGHIIVRSVVGEGTTFTVLLPRAGQGCSEATDALPADSHHGNGEHLLLAVDDPDVRSVLVSSLTSLGYEVMCTEDESGILDACGKPGAWPELLILDVETPDKNGLDCLRELRAAGCRTPAILISTDLGPDDQDEIPARTLLLRKPFQVRTLWRLVVTALAPPHRSGGKR